MLDTRRYDDREHLTLASYAMHSRDSQGRKHDEGEHSYRGPFARDRDRILHSSAFRRLSGKMQVFTGEMGIYHRTRLTHTIEVASIARTMARVLRLNEDFTEALALVHDIGHPPYGHCGEDALSECMQRVGGFSHNGFASVIVEELEQRYADFPGLNLTLEILDGQVIRANKAHAAIGIAPLLEVQLVDAADSMAYDAHDVDDALQLGLLSMHELSELAIVRRALEMIKQRCGTDRIRQLRQALVHQLIDLQVTDFLQESSERLLPCQSLHAGDVRHAGVRLEHSDDLRRERGELEAFLFDAVYRHQRLIPVRRAAYHRVQDMFQVLTGDPKRLPLRFRRRTETRPIESVVGEYLAGMTDAFCDTQYRYATDGSTGPLADW
ncbi:MAG: metal-dependent phosphohydrolase [Rhodopirellula sp. TMED11]|nr:MAG: metal-dependent phosphohydrolase [Rhodopirellula sp. TMED11]OUT59239.1 MAG: metal-dependent phosphohydrolase [Rhodopirellula sp. TMED11]